MKIVALRRAFFNGEIIKVGDVLNIDGETIPSWAKRVGRAPKQEDAQQSQPQTQQKAEETPAEQIPADVQTAREELKEINAEMIAEENADVIVAGDGGLHVVPNLPDEFANKTDEELTEILNKLLDETCAKGIMIDGLESLTIIGQIIALRDKLAETVEGENQ